VETETVSLGVLEMDSLSFEGIVVLAVDVVNAAAVKGDIKLVKKEEIGAGVVSSGVAGAGDGVGVGDGVVINAIVGAVVEVVVLVNGSRERGDFDNIEESYLGMVGFDALGRRGVLADANTFDGLGKLNDGGIPKGGREDLGKILAGTPGLKPAIAERGLKIMFLAVPGLSSGFCGSFAGLCTSPLAGDIELTDSDFSKTVSFGMDESFSFSFVESTTFVSNLVVFLLVLFLSFVSAAWESFLERKIIWLTFPWRLGVDCSIPPISFTSTSISLRMST